MKNYPIGKVPLLFFYQGYSEQCCFQEAVQVATCKERSQKLLKFKHLTLNARKKQICLFKMFSLNGVAFHCLSKTLT